MQIKLEKKYPHIRDEDVTQIFNDGYIKGFENGRKNAIPIEWMQQMIEEDKSSGHIDEYGEYQEGTTLGESCEHVLTNWYNTYKWKWEKENE